MTDANPVESTLTRFKVPGTDVVVTTSMVRGATSPETVEFRTTHRVEPDELDRFEARAAALPFVKLVLRGELELIAGYQSNAIVYFDVPAGMVEAATAAAAKLGGCQWCLMPARLLDRQQGSATEISTLQATPASEQAPATSTQALRVTTPPASIRSPATFSWRPLGGLEPENWRTRHKRALLARNQ